MSIATTIFRGISQFGELLSEARVLKNKISEFKNPETKIISSSREDQDNMHRAAFEESVNDDDLKLEQQDQDDYDDTPSNPAGSSKPQEEPSLLDAISNFITGNGVAITTFVSTALNIVSAPLRIAKADQSKLSDKFNKVSMFATKTHLIALAFSGIKAAIDEKNPLLVASYIAEGMCALAGNVRDLYLMRGLATALDPLSGAFAHKIGRGFKSFGECTVKSWDAFSEMIKEILQDPLVIFKEQKGHDIVVSSIVTFCSSLYGLFVNDKVGGTMRDLSGALSDIGVYRLPSDKAQVAGISYIAGSVFDCIARFFSHDTAKLFSPDRKLGNVFEGLRNTMHEIGIALDRIGQFLFLRYQQDETAKAMASKGVTNGVN